MAAASQTQPCAASNPQEIAAASVVEFFCYAVFFASQAAAATLAAAWVCPIPLRFLALVPPPTPSAAKPTLPHHERQLVGQCRDEPNLLPPHVCEAFY